jgi:hypothetical protein
MEDTITTLGCFRRATKAEKNDLQIYVQNEDGSYTEITEITKVLPKRSDEKSYIVLRAR